MSQRRKRLQIETLLGSSDLSVTQISKKLGFSVATIYRAKSGKQHNAGLEHHKGAGRPPRLRLSIKRSRELRYTGLFTMFDHGLFEV